MKEQTFQPGFRLSVLDIVVLISGVIGMFYASRVEHLDPFHPSGNADGHWPTDAQTLVSRDFLGTN